MNMKVLKEYIRKIFGGAPKDVRLLPGAGIIVLRKFGNEFKVLCLQDKDALDLTKGGVGPGETRLQAAIRETYEESSIHELAFQWGLEPYFCRNIAMFIASTSQDPEVLPNPESGEYEHTAAYWLSFGEAKALIKPWLRPAIIYAEDKVT